VSERPAPAPGPTRRGVLGRLAAAAAAVVLVGRRRRGPGRPADPDRGDPPRVRPRGWIGH
jgi:hypothetical protein